MASPLHNLTDEELIAEFQQGEESAFDLLVSRYKDQLTNFVFRLLGDTDDCNDVVQETFIRLYRKRHAYTPVAKFTTWIHTIALNLARSYLRRRKLRDWLPIGIRPEGESGRAFELADLSARTDQRVESAIQDEYIQKALLLLPIKFREAVIMRDVEEMSYEEIALITGLNIGTVKSRINRGRNQLQDLLRDIWNDEQ